MQQKYLYIGIGVVVVILIGGYFFFARSATPQLNTQAGSGFGTGAERQVTVTPPTQSSGGTPSAAQTSSSVSQKIFEINAGPVVGATLLEEGQPTTTVARFVMQDSGHVFDLPLDSPGAVARAISNTTIPGIATAFWSEAGQGLVAQYLDGATVKTLHLEFPPATTTLSTQAPATITFFPDGISSIAVSPSGTSAAYLVAGAAGSDGYISNVDGSAATKVFSLPFSQMLISWPAQSTLMAQTPAAAGIPGVLFSIDAKSGAANPILYADGLTATADVAFSKVVYQITERGNRSTYVRDVGSGLSSPLSFDPLPEQCVWSPTASSTLYCAAPLAYVDPTFLDLWHLGEASAPDSIFAFDVAAGTTQIITVPGGNDGGEASDIAQMAVSPDGRYLIFVKKGDRSLWGVRLTQ